MIYALIALSAAGVVIAALAIIATIALRRNSRLEREKKFDRLELESALAGNTALKAEKAEALQKMQALYNKMLRERNELVARSTALQEALEAKPTQPKRVVRKNSLGTSNAVGHTQESNSTAGGEQTP